MLKISRRYPVLHASASAILALLTPAIISACASTPEPMPVLDTGTRLAMTQDLRQQYALGEGELAGLQYWVSDDIRLRRITARGDRRIESGRIVERTGQTVDDIIIRADTPGIAVGSGPDWIAVSFEPSSYLYFSSSVDGLHVTGVSPDGRHYLWADDWHTGGGIVSINGVQYQASPGDNLAHLLVGLTQVNQVRATEKVLPGRRIGGAPLRSNY